MSENTATVAPPSEYRVLSDIVLVRKLEQPPESAIIFTEDPDKDLARYGEVLAVGPGRKNKKTGIRMPMSVKVGDTVMFGSYTGEDHLCLIDKELQTFAIREPDIMAVVEEAEDRERPMYTEAMGGSAS